MSKLCKTSGFFWDTSSDLIVNIVISMVVWFLVSSRKRGWRRYYTMIRDLKLLMFKSEREAPAIPAANKAINLDNLFAAVASHYKKKKHALTLTCADGSEYMLVCG